MIRRGLAVVIDGRRYRCTSADAWDHQGDTCPIHEDEAHPAYAPTLGRGRQALLTLAAVSGKVGS